MAEERREHPRMNFPMVAHADLPWERVKPCVYCACGVRLYQGHLPGPELTQQEFAEALDAMVGAAKQKVGRSGGDD